MGQFNATPKTQQVLNSPSDPLVSNGRTNEQSSNGMTDEQLQQVVTQLLAERLQAISVQSNNAEVLATYTYPRHGPLITTRKVLSAIALGILSICIVNTFLPLSQSIHQLAIGFGVSLAGIVCGLGIVILLVSEIFLGAGSEVEVEVQRDGSLFRDYKFVPSIDRLPFVLLFLGLAFITLLFGFASLYAELFRQNPDHFSGLRDGLLSLYFALVTFSTVGYGDIFPVSMTARMTAVCEIAIAMFFSLVALSTTLSWVTAYERQQHDEFVKQRIQALHIQRSQLTASPSAPNDSCSDPRSQDLDQSVES